LIIIIWRYLLSQYIKVLSLSLVAFIAVLLTTRLDDIAHFASLGAQGLYVLKFTMHQVPYILPIAIPVSALISSLLLIQRLSSSHELTAMRAAGLSISSILSPILVFASYLAVFNFYMVSEVATESHLATNTLKSELRQVNPLLVLHNKHMMRLKGIYFDSLGESKVGETASDVLLAMPGKGDNPINLMVAKNLHSSDTDFSGSAVTYISSIKSDDGRQFDHLMIENMAKSITSINDFSQMLQKKIFNINNDHLRLGLLLTKISEEKERLMSPQETPEEIKVIKRNINRAYTEIIRRLSIGIAAFTFTLMGLSFGASISRHQSGRGVLYLIALAALYLVCFFVAKSIEYQFMASLILYLVPHAIIVFFSILNLNRLSRGIE
jgi:lipopolysaccharide export system permease protein